MSTYVFSLNDISVEDGSPVVSVNNSDSFFGLIEGSQLFIAGKLPATIIDHDTTANTLTLKYNWQQGDLSNVAAQVVPIGAVGVLLQALENNRAAYAAFLENAGSGEVEWENINNPPQTSLRWPNFSELAGKISKEQLPDDIDTDNKKTQAMSPPIKREASLNQRLVDYPTLKKTEVSPTESPNNRRLIQFDDVRTEVHISLTDRWFTIPTTIASRAFSVFYRGLILRFNNNSSYTGNIKMRVYPMGTGGLGLPNNPTLANHQWHEYETSVTNLYKIGEFNSSYFEGIIEYIELDNGWHQFDVNQSDVSSLNAKFDVAFGTFRSPFRTFYQKTDGFWYSDDMTPDVPHSIGASWTQDANNPRLFTVTNAEDGNDGLRFFSDSFDDFQFEIVLDVTSLSFVMALTISNSDPNKVYLEGPARFITDERIFFKRAGTRVSSTFTIESIKMRIPHYG
ncbi:hypothetical protein ACM257_19975 [Alteromonas macleodii]|uniref:hypothetical protein n=1 Tax=Alteromonas macleodii TaxID=28108 RepID=UPI0039F6528E